MDKKKDKDLKKLNRAELLELLIIQTKEVERLRAKLEKAEAKLKEKRIKLEETGDIAHAALKVNDVFEAAQAAADQYLENIKAMEAETAQKCKAMLQDAKRKAVKIRYIALAEAKRVSVDNESH